MLLLIVTCAIYIWIGFYFSKKVKTASDFLIAGRNLPLPILAATIAATSFGGGCLVGGVQWGAERGLWVGMYSTIGAALACFINAFFAGKLRNLSCDITPADYIETRYGHSVFLRAYQSLVTPISILAIMGSQLISFGSVSTAFGIPYDIAVIIGVIVIIIYTYTSGMWGVAVSAFIQLAICIVFLPIVAYISLKLVGDNPLLMLQSMVKEPFFPGDKSISDFMYTVLPLVLGSIFSYESFLRYQCADNAKNAVKSSVIAGFILLFLAFPIGIIGAIGGSLFPNISSVQVLPQMISTTLPPLISVLFLAAILAAIMSTADSLMTSMSAIISRDIYNKLLHPNIEFNDLKNTLKYSQVASAFTAIIGAIIALKFDSLLELLFWPAPLCTGVIFAPFVIGLCWKGATKKGAIYAVTVSVILAFLNMIGILTVSDRILVPIIGGSITIFIVSKFSKRLKREVYTVNMSKSEKGKETKASIIRAARELFFEQGYHKTTTRQIAERANTNLGLISYYFSSKSEIGAIIYEDIRNEMQSLIYNYHEEGTMMMFFLAMNADLCFLLKNEAYRNFYLDIAYEEAILSYQRSVTEMVMKRYVNDKESIEHDELILSCIGILAMKPEIIRVYISHKYDISSQAVIKYFTKQFLINLGHSTDLCEDILEELSKYYIDIVDNFTPIITRIRT